MSYFLDKLLEIVPREQPWKFQVTCPATKESMYAGADDQGAYHDKLLKESEDDASL